MRKSGLTFALLGDDKCLSRQLCGPNSSIDMSYSSASILINYLEKKGMLLYEPKGRSKKITLTHKGREVKNHLLNIITIIEGIDRNVQD